MQLLPIDRLGAREVSPGQVQFGVFLPWVSGTAGNRLHVKIIHERDQFLQGIPALRFPLQHSVDPIYGDFWSAQIPIDPTDRPTPESAWGQLGTYVYRFELSSPLLAKPLDWIVDPYAREFGIGRMSAFTLGYTDYPWGAVEQTWKTPQLHDLVVYEVMLNEFATGLDGAIGRLPYLRDLGINCIEVMPVANVERTVDWGFEPIGLFGVDERFGNRRDFQRFVEAAHASGIAILLDKIYGHTGRHFAYESVYSALGYHENPFMGSFGDADMFGASTDFRRTFVRDFYFTVNWFWLDRFHADGIRYDCVPNYWDGATGVGFASLVFNTYKKVQATGPAGHWQRFFSAGKINLVQCAEQLEKPVEAMSSTYANCTWQNGTLAAANGVASDGFTSLTDFGLRLGLQSYPLSASHGPDTLDKSAFQYLENHDHPRFICRFGTDNLYRDILREGRRENWFRLQPYIIGLLLGKGIPLLWEGQEILEKYDVPDDGPARIGTLRPVRWELFYDDIGRSTIQVYRKLLSIRNRHSVYRRGEFHFHNHWDRWQSRGLLLFSRWSGSTYSLIALNFSGVDQTTTFWFPSAGDYGELIHGTDNLHAVVAGQPTDLTVPSNYGRVWLHP